MLLTGLNPMFLFVSASANNDNMISVLATVILILLVRTVQEGVSSRRRVSLLGVLIGLACLSKLSGLALIPLGGLGLLIARLSEAGDGGMDTRLLLERVLHPRDNAKVWRRVLGVWALDMVYLLIPVLVIAGWWYWRNWALYGDPTGMSMMLEIFGRRKQPPGLLGLLGEFQGFRISYWGLFGVVNVLLRPEWVYPLLDCLLLFGALGGLLRVAHLVRKRRWPPRLASALLCGIWIAVVAASLVRWTSMTKASQGRLVYPAIAAIGSLAAYGFTSWFRREHEVIVSGALALGMGMLAVATPWLAIRPAYMPPTIITSADIPPSAQPYGVRYGEGIELAAVDVGEMGEQSGTPGFPLTLFWHCQGTMDQDYSLYVHVFDRDGSKLGQRDSYPGGGLYPTSQWSVGAVIADRYWVPIKQQPQAPIAAEVEVGFYDIHTMRKLAARDPAGQPLGRPIIGRVSVPTATTRGEPQTAASAQFQSLALYGYDLDSSLVQPGDDVLLRQYWQVTDAPSEDWIVFVHLVDASGELVAQADGPPLGGHYPCSYWRSGEWLEDERRLSIPASAAGQRLQLIVGFYRRDSGARMPLLGADGAVIGDNVVLCELEVSR